MQTTFANPSRRGGQPVGRLEHGLWTRRREGHGAPWVLLNGVPVTGAVWEPLCDALCERLACPLVVADLPGTGGSLMEGGRVTWTSQRAALRRWLRTVQPSVLVVHDVAGPVALPLLAEGLAPGGAVVLNTILRPSAFRPLALMRLLSVPGLGGLLAASVPAWAYVAGVRRLGLGRPGAVAPALLRRLHFEALGAGRWRDLHATMRGFERDRATDDAIQRGLTARAGRLLVVWAPADPALGKEIRHLAVHGLGAQVHQLPDAKHFPMLDHPTEIAELALAWWSRLVTSPVPPREDRP